MNDAEAQLRLEASTVGLAERVPLLSARSLLSSGQRRFLVALIAALALGLAFSADTTLVVLISLATAVYLWLVAFRFRLFLRSAREDGLVMHVSDQEARAESPSTLPTYTILVPAYREPEVINHLLDNITRIEYPLDLLQVLLLVEADDVETIGALAEADTGPQFELVFVPPAEPRTKPKALNYGLSLATGELVTVYDAEDVPDPLQLRRAAVSLRRDPSLACLQSKLSYHNVTQNLITKWFTIEYTMWFCFFLPGLTSLRAPIPLGGTSNHFRRTALRSIGAWDPYNVTEDADLGVRFAREGYSVGVLDSTTLEEANSDFVNWVRQRSRWYKGYLQSLFVHMRTPRCFTREVGPAGLLNFLLFVGGTPVLGLLNPVFWVMTPVWFLAQPLLLKDLFPAPVYYLAMTSMVLGNLMLVYLTVISCRLVGRVQLLGAALLVPLYWTMMSLAAVKAVCQLVTRPSHWEKTFHGLAREGLASQSRPR